MQWLHTLLSTFYHLQFHACMTLFTWLWMIPAAQNKSIDPLWITSKVSTECPCSGQLHLAEAITHLCCSQCRIKCCSNFLIKQMRWKTGGFSDVIVMIRVELLTFQLCQRAAIMDFACRMSAKICYNSNISWLKPMLFFINSSSKLTGDLSFTALCCMCDGVMSRFFVSVILWKRIKNEIIYN